MAGLNSTTLEQLAEFNQEFFHYRIPALVYLGLMLPLGILGNVSVIYIYGFRLKQSNVHLLITFLAASDMIGCLVCIPMEMYWLFVFYNYTSTSTCKVEGFFLFACYICSALILLVISVERYVKVCRSMGTQMSRKIAMILAGAAFIVSTLSAVPVPLFVVPHAYSLDNGMVALICSYHIEVELYYYYVVFFAFLLCIFGAMSVLYWRVMKTTRSHVKRCQERKAQSNVDAVHEATHVPQSVTKAKMLRQTNRVVVCISAVYVASCVPGFITVGVSKFVTYRQPQSPVNYLIFIAINTWALNCTLNPIVYGLLNSKFRSELRAFFNQNLSRKKLETSEESNQTGSTAT